MATVELSFSPLPAHVRTARLVATAVARRSGVDETLLDEMRLAVGEACSRAVEEHRRQCPDRPVRMEMSNLGGRFEIAVRDCVPPAPALVGSSQAPGSPASASAGSGPVPAGFGLAVISGLVDDVQVMAASTGVSIVMAWPITTKPQS